MLCSLEPVRCWSRLPNWSGATIRRSTARPLCVCSRTPASLGVAGALDEVELARRPRESERVGRRRDDVEVLDAVGHPPRRAGELNPLRGRMGTERRDELLADGERPIEHEPPPGPVEVGAVERLEQAPPRPSGQSPSGRGSAARSPPRAAPRGESIPSSSNSRRARLGPRPGRCVICTSPGGYFARSLTSAGISPVSASARTFSWIVAPIPGSSVARPARASAAIDCRRVPNRLGGVPVGDDPVDDRAVELVEVAELVERLRDLGVRRFCHRCAYPSDPL